MKRYNFSFLFSAAVLLLVLAAAGCTSESAGPEGGTPNDSTTQKNAATESESGTRYSWKIEPGTSWSIKTLETTTTILNPGSANESRSANTVTILRKANYTALDKEMAMNLTISYLDIGSSKGEGGKGSGTASANDSRLGKSLEVRLEPSTGQVLGVRGATEIFKEDGMEKLADLADALYVEAFNSEFYIYPDGPVEVGGSWQRTGRLKLPYGLNVSHTYTLDKLMSKQGFLKRTSVFSPGEALPGMPVYQLNGTSTADFNFDEATGLIYSRLENATLEGTVSNNGKATPVRIELSTVSEMTPQ
jgi:hypothetical protein